MDRLRTASSAGALVEPGADWVKDMHEYRARTGVFRPEDIQRLLGDPRKGVGIPVESELAAAANPRPK